MGAALEALDGLTVQQAAFVSAYVAHEGNGQTAYQSVYDSAMSPSVASAAASRLLKNVNVQAAIADACDAVGLTPESHLRKLAELRDQAARANQYGSAVKGEELRGRVAGYYVDKREELSHTEHTVRFVFEQRKTTAG